MWVVWSILAFLAALVTVILLSPVKVIIKNDDKEGFILRYKLLYKTFGENPDPDDVIVKALKKSGGVTRLEKAAMQENIRSEGLQQTVSDSYEALIGILKELLFLLKRCTVTRLFIKIRCAEDEPDETALYYGLCNAATHTLLGTLSAFLKIRKRGCKIDIGYDFEGGTPLFRYEVILAVPFGRVLAAFWRLVLAEAKRVAAEEAVKQNAPKPPANAE